jgi:hypothetical protein
MNANKANYKIFNKVTNKYESKSSGKATWSSPGWVLEAVKGMHRKEADLEIHIFPIQEPRKVPLSIFKAAIEEDKARAKNNKADKAAALAKKNEKLRLNNEIVSLESRLEELKRKQNQIC